MTSNIDLTPLRTARQLLQMQADGHRPDVTEALQALTSLAKQLRDPDCEMPISLLHRTERYIAELVLGA